MPAKQSYENRLSIHIPASMRARIEAYAQRHHLQRSAAIRALIELSLKNWEEKQK